MAIDTAALDAFAAERVAADVYPAPTDNEAHQAAAALVEKYGPVRAKLIDTLYRSHTLQEDKVTLDIFIKALDQFELDLSHAETIPEDWPKDEHGNYIGVGGVPAEEHSNG